MIQELHEIMGLMSKASTRVELSWLSPPMGVREMCEMFLAVAIGGAKGVINPAVCGAVCL